MSAEYLKELRESLEVCDSETFKDIYFDYRKAGLPECLETVLESVAELAEFIIVVEDAGNFDGLKEIMENMLEETGVNLLTDSEGREPDMESMSLQRFKNALIHRFDTDNFNSVKEGIVCDFLMPAILEGIRSSATRECSEDTEAKRQVEAAALL